MHPKWQRRIGTTLMLAMSLMAFTQEISTQEVTPSEVTLPEVTLYDQGLELYRADMFEDAMALFAQHIAENPDDIKVDDAQWRIGRSLRALDRVAEAEQAFRDVAAISDGNRRDEATFDLGQLLFDAGEFEESFEVLTGFLRDFPTSNRADDGQWYLGEIHADAGRVDEAEELFRRIAAIADSNRQDEATYSLGELLYFERRNEEAFEVLTEFRQSFPNDIKADDALWRIGRLHMRFDQDLEAEQAFLDILALPKTNRAEEATYDLGRLMYARDDFEEVIALFRPLYNVAGLDLYERRSVKLAAKAHYALGLRAQSDYRDAVATEHFTAAAEWYEHLLTEEEDATERAEVSLGLGKSYDHLLDLARDSKSAARHAALAESALLTAATGVVGNDLADAESRLNDIANAQAVSFRADIDALGGIENLAVSLGATVDAKAAVIVPLGFQQELRAEVSYDHDSFAVKTFNFAPTKTGTARMIEWTETLAAELGWRAGSSRSFRNDLIIGGSVRWAEDLGDNRYIASADDALRWRFAPEWRLDWDNSAKLTVYPDYLSGTNKIDSVGATSRPEVSFYGLDPITVSIAYEFDLKQYLQSTWGGSTLNRQYLTNSAAIEAKGAFGLFRPTLSYEISLLESNNYDLTVGGLPTSQFVLDYWDNLTHDIALDADFRWTPHLRTQIGGDLVVRSFLNYPARDVTKTFTGELRQDVSLGIDAEISYIFWEGAGTTASAVMTGWWDHETSNMLYESTFETNYDSFGGLLGVSVRMR